MTNKEIIERLRNEDYSKKYPKSKLLDIVSKRLFMLDVLIETHLTEQEKKVMEETINE